jgi:uncharacterized membrane protein YciS (DUF1049 family)
MLPGPFQMPVLPQLPFYIHPILLWAIILIAAVGLAVTFFKFIFAESNERVSSFLTFFLVAAVIAGAYTIAVNWVKVSAFFQRL